VPFISVELTPEEEALALATLDPLTNMAGTDAAKLDELLQQVQTDEAAIQAMLAQLASRAGLYPSNPWDEWQGMPEFENEAQESFLTLKVHFATSEDVANFANLLGQTVTDKSRYIWFPPQQPSRWKEHVAHEP